MLALTQGCLLRSAVLLGAMLCLRRCLRHRSAEVRHRFLLFTFLLLAVEPLIYLCVPQLVFAWPNSVANVATQQTFRRGAAVSPALRASFYQQYWPVLLYFAGLITIMAGLLRSWRTATLMRLRAMPAGEAWIGMLRELCRAHGIRHAPQIRISAETIIPFACGLWQQAIVLPSDCDGWTLARKRSVLLHELAHLQRRDLYVHLFASLVTALWWFQPLAWWAYRVLRRESEMASDEFVVRAGVRASDYADDLLEIAHACGGRARVPAAVIGIARQRGLAARVTQLLRAQQPRATSRRMLLVLLSTCTALTVTVSAVTMDAQENSKGGVFMKRAMIAGLLAGTGISAAANVSGTVYDESGAALKDAKVAITDLDSSSSEESTTDPQGKFEFTGLHEGEYILRVQRPGFASLLREFHLESASDVQRGLTLQMNAAGTAAPEPNHPQELRVGGAFEQSKLIHKVTPKYPVAAKTAGIQGTVKLEASISKEGVPLDIRVLSSPDDELAESALEAVRQWRYQSTLLNGQPVDVVTEIVVNYTLAP